MNSIVFNYENYYENYTDARIARLVPTGLLNLHMDDSVIRTNAYGGA